MNVLSGHVKNGKLTFPLLEKIKLECATSKGNGVS